MPSHPRALRQSDARVFAFLTNGLVGHVANTSGGEGSFSATCKGFRSRPVVLQESLDPCPEIRRPLPPAVSRHGPRRASLLSGLRALALRGPPGCGARTQNTLEEKALKSRHSHESRIPVPASPLRLRKDSGSNSAGHAHQILWRVCPFQIPCRYHLVQQTRACPVNFHTE